MKPNLLLLIATFSITFLMTSSCKKENANTLATVIYTGERAADGCGWLVKINATDSVYSPVNLPDNYKVNNLQVLISYTKLGTRFQCGLSPAGGANEIKLGSIKKE